MKKETFFRFAAPLLLAAFLPQSGQAAGFKDQPDWPCQQRMVPDIALGTVWNGPDLAPYQDKWTQDAGIDDLVSSIAPRRVTMDEAGSALDKLVADHPQDANDKLLETFTGLYHRLNNERSEVQKGIIRFAKRQKQTAASLKQRTADLSIAQEKGDTPREQLAKTYDELMFETRIFEEREHSVSFVCEVPTIIEQRLGEFGKLVMARLKK